MRYRSYWNPTSGFLPTTAEGEIEEAPAYQTQEQTNLCPTVGTHIDLLARRGTPHAADKDRAAGRFDFIYAKGITRYLAF